MKQAIFIIGITFFLSGCSWFSKEEAQNKANALKEKSLEYLEQGKETAEDIRQQAEGVRDGIKQRVDDVGTAVQEIREAEEAVGNVFGARYKIDIEREKSDLCLSDDECVVVEFEGCCSTLRALNKEYLEHYNNTPAWQKDDTDCSQVVCEDISEYTKAACLPSQLGAQRCMLVKP